jgi:asparagine N-glycosylation enzyme membrane subunit Stt3
MTIKSLKTKGLTFGSLFKLNIFCFSVVYGALFLLVGIVNLFKETSIEPSANGISVTGLSAIGLLLVLYPIFVIGHSLIMGALMLIGQSIYAKFKPIEITIKA